VGPFLRACASERLDARLVRRELGGRTGIDDAAVIEGRAEREGIERRVE